MKTLGSGIFTLLLLIFGQSAFSQSFSSTTQATQLIELYTSEGCSSCPPADRWLNKLKNNPNLWSKFIPMAFHVDYWDYIGWKDPFANSQFSARQHQYARESNLSSVYTPSMLLNGHEWTAWRRYSDLNLPTTSFTTGRLSITVGGGELIANYQAAVSQSSELILNIAILGFNMESNVNAGENIGNTFTHDFVVLGFKRVAMKQTSNDLYTGSVDALPELSQSSSKLAISAWVNAENNLTPLQATGGWIE